MDNYFAIDSDMLEGEYCAVNTCLFCHRCGGGQCQEHGPCGYTLPPVQVGRASGCRYVRDVRLSRVVGQ